MRTTVQNTRGATAEQSEECARSWSLRVDQAWRTLEATRSAIDRADNKAAIVLASSGATGAALFSLVDAHRPLAVAATIAVSICAVSVLVAAAFAGLVLLPRRERGSAPTSLLYFDHVFRMTDMDADTYAALTTRLFGDPAELCREISTQIWTTSKVAAAKYTWVHRSMIGLFAALIAVGTAALAIGIG